MAHDSVAFAASFFNYSIGAQSHNSSICFGNLSAFNNSVASFMSQVNMKQYQNLGYTLQSMVAAVNPIAQACYFSGFEYYQVF